MKRDEEQRLSIAIRGLLQQVPPDQPVRKVAVLKELGPKFDRMSIEDLTDALARHCSALGRTLSNERDKSAHRRRAKFWRRYHTTMTVLVLLRISREQFNS